MELMALKKIAICLFLVALPLLIVTARCGFFGDSIKATLIMLLIIASIIILIAYPQMFEWVLYIVAGVIFFLWITAQRE